MRSQLEIGPPHHLRPVRAGAKEQDGHRLRTLRTIHAHHRAFALTRLAVEGGFEVGGVEVEPGRGHDQVLVPPLEEKAAVRLLPHEVAGGQPAFAIGEGLGAVAPVAG